MRTRRRAADHRRCRTRNSARVAEKLISYPPRVGAVRPRRRPLFLAATRACWNRRSCCPGLCSAAYVPSGGSPACRSSSRQGTAAREREEGPARLRRKDVHASESAGTREDLVILLSPLGGASNQRPRRAVGQIGVHVQNTELIYTCSVDRVCPKS